MIRWNPSPFEREGVPGNGWSVAPAAREPAMLPVAIEILPDGDGVLVDDITLRLFDEPDVGDLYTFCYAEEGQAPSSPASIELEGPRFERHGTASPWCCGSCIERTSRSCASRA